MAEEVTKYISTIEFNSKDAMRKLAAYEKKMDAFQNKQIKMSRMQAVSRSGGSGGGYNSARNTLLADMLRKEELAAKEMAKQKNFNNNLELKNISQQERASKAAKNFNNNLELKHQAQQERAKSSTQKALNADKNRANNLELKNAAATEKAKDALKNALWTSKKYNTQQEKSLILKMEEQLATAKTARQVRRIAAVTKSQLRDQRESNRQLEKQNFLFKRMQSSSQQIAGNMVSAFAVAAGVAGITKVGQQFESVNNTMLAVSTNTKEAGENFKFVRDESYRLGLSLSESGKSFAKLVAARGNMSLADTKEAFLGVAEASTLLGLSSEESGRAINALMQMASKGSISAEELSFGSIHRNVSK